MFDLSITVWVVLVVINIPLYIWFFRIVYGNFKNFLDELFYMIPFFPFKKDLYEYYWYNLKGIAFIGSCVGCVMGEAFLFKKIFG